MVYEYERGELDQTGRSTRGKGGRDSARDARGCRKPWDGRGRVWSTNAYRQWRQGSVDLMQGTTHRTMRVGTVPIMLLVGTIFLVYRIATWFGLRDLIRSTRSGAIGAEMVQPGRQAGSDREPEKHRHQNGGRADAIVVLDKLLHQTLRRAYQPATCGSSRNLQRNLQRTIGDSIARTRLTTPPCGCRRQTHMFRFRSFATWVAALTVFAFLAASASAWTHELAHAGHENSADGCAICRLAEHAPGLIDPQPPLLPAALHTLVRVVGAKTNPFPDRPRPFDARGPPTIL